MQAIQKPGPRNRLSESEFARYASQYAILANKIARKLSRDDEAESVARLALIEAIRDFDPSRGVKLSTYLCRRIGNRVLDHVRRYQTACRRGLEGGCKFIELIPDKNAADLCREAGPRNTDPDSPPPVLDFLPPELKRIAAARWWYGARIGEIAESLGVDRRTVDRRLREARDILARELELTCNP